MGELCNAGGIEIINQFSHIVSETGTLEKIHKQLAGIKSRWVRTVEWEIRALNDLLDKTSIGDDSF